MHKAIIYIQLNNVNEPNIVFLRKYVNKVQQIDHTRQKWFA